MHKTILSWLIGPYLNSIFVNLQTNISKLFLRNTKNYSTYFWFSKFGNLLSTFDG